MFWPAASADEVMSVAIAIARMRMGLSI